MQRILQKLYDSLTRNDPVQNVDLIFVMAGRMDRKPYGLDLYRAGTAPRLILSIGRFEVSKIKRLQLPIFDELVLLRDKTAPNERHFFIEMAGSGCHLHRVKLSSWNTYGEALALHAFVSDQNLQHVMIISTDIHLRRIALTFRKLFRNSPLHFVYCAVPSAQSTLQRNRWWTRRNDRRYVVREMIKFCGYRMILFMPAPVSHWLMFLAVRLTRLAGNTR